MNQRVSRRVYRVAADRMFLVLLTSRMLPSRHHPRHGSRGPAGGFAGEHSVSGIVAFAAAKTTVFYRHYRDKYELARAVFDEAIEEMDREMGPPRYTSEQIEAAAGPPEPLVRFFEYIAANSRLYTMMTGSDGDPWFTAHMREHLGSFVEQRILTREKLRLASVTNVPKGMPRKVAVSMLAASFVGIMSWWLEDGMKHAPAQMAAWLRHALMSGYLTRATRKEG